MTVEKKDTTVKTATAIKDLHDDDLNIQEAEAAEEREYRPTNIIITEEQFAKDYVLITGEGTKYVNAGNVSTIQDVMNGDKEPVTSTHEDTEGEQLKKYIVNTRAVSRENKDKVIQLFKDNGGEVDLAQLNGLTMSTSSNLFPESREDLCQELPMRGEKMKVTVGLIENREGKKVLGIEKFLVGKAEKAPSFSFGEAIELPSEEKVG